MAQNVLVVGLGNLGEALARRIASRQALVAVESDAQRRRACAEWHRGPVCGALSQVEWSEVERVLVSVRTSDQALRVLDEVEECASGGIAVHIHTTLDLTTAESLAERGASGLRVLEQPVTGGAAGAADGGLVVISAGPATPADHEWSRSLSYNVVEFDRYGDPSLAKLLNNAAASYNLAAAIAVLRRGSEQGLDAERLRSILQQGSGGAWITGALDRLGDDQVRLLAKDLDLLQRATAPLDAPRVTNIEEMLERVRDVQALLTSPIEER